MTMLQENLLPTAVRNVKLNYLVKAMRQKSNQTVGKFIFYVEAVEKQFSKRAKD